MSKLLAALRNPYALIGQGFLFGGLIVLATQDGREARRRAGARRRLAPEPMSA